MVADGRPMKLDEDGTESAAPERHVDTMAAPVDLTENASL
jgi:hypothetical protein